ncbi:unnamed protein product [Orchesella dallaii]|uniref:Uncharacterized protein n=1 Tax=Orchesella dallaii TaxID=48710 RepID=A0ABP1Q5U3_9HEXA
MTTGTGMMNDSARDKRRECQVSSSNPFQTPTAVAMEMGYKIIDKYQQYRQHVLIKFDNDGCPVQQETLELHFNHHQFHHHQDKPSSVQTIVCLINQYLVDKEGVPVKHETLEFHFIHRLLHHHHQAKLSSFTIISPHHQFSNQQLGDNEGATRNTGIGEVKTIVEHE